MKKIIIKADKNCKYCSGKSRCTNIIGGINVCRCITDQIDIRNSDGEKTLLVKTKDDWELRFGDETNEQNSM